MAQNRPLYDNDADRELFVVPPAWDPVRRAIDRGLNTVVVGARGSGKTTLLRQLQLTLRDAGERVAFVDACAVDGVGELTIRIRDAARGRSAPIVESFGQLQAALPDPSPPPREAARLPYNHLADLAPLAQTVLLVDASDSCEAVYELFGRMRDVLWQLPHLWIVAIDDHERGTALKPPADAFFDAIVRMHPMTTEMVTDVLERREAWWEPRVRAAIAANAAGNPRAAIQASNDAAIHGRDPLSDLQGRAGLLDTASRLGRPHAMLMAELLDRGQGGPSDDELRRSLGLSRPRLTKLLHELLEHDLVTASTERAEGPGRPRTVYRPLERP